jgi:hypothetical protein
MQRLLQSPQSVFAMRGLDQDQTGWIETENVEAMTVKPAKFAHLIAWDDKEGRLGSSQAGKDCGHESEGGGCGARFGYDLMQAAASQAALREVGIKGGKAERDRCGQILNLGQQASEFRHNNGAASGQFMGIKLGHDCAGPVDIHCMFST